MTYNLILFHLCERVILFSSVASYYFSGSYIPSALFGENEVSSSRICVQHRYKSFLISTAESLFTVWLLLIATLWMESAAQAQVVPLAVAAFPGNTVVGQQATPLTVTVTVVHSDTASAPIVITQGNANLDFKPAGSGSCASGTNYLVGQQCTVDVIFSPLYPGLRSGAVVLTNSSGTVLGYTLLSGMATGSLGILVPGRIDTVAGDGAWIYSQDGVPATLAPIFLPTGIVVDTAGNLFLSDSKNNRIRRVDATTGMISTVAGIGTPGYSGDGGLATQAMISNPAGIVMDGAGNLYFADMGNHAIRRIDAASGVISTIVGTLGAKGYSGDGAAASSAKLSLPEGLAFDSAQNLYIADTGNNVVRRVSATTGFISTVVGTGVAGFSGDGGAAVSAQLNTPWSLTFGADGSFYIADLTNNVVRKVGTDGKISTVAGNASLGYSGDTGIATSAQLNSPASIVFDTAGNMYIADSGNNRVRKVYSSTQIIQTISGTSSDQFAGDTGPANLASFYGPYALYMDQSGNLFVADMFHNRIRRISAGAISIEYPVMRVGKVSAPQSEGLENDGNAGLTISAPTLVDAALDSSTTTCNIGTVVASGLSCNLGVEFAPTVVGDPADGSIAVNSDASNRPALISLSGEVLSVEPTSVSLASSANPSLIGASVTFTAAVSSASPTLTGAMVFLDGMTQLCSASLAANGSAACTVSTLTLGQHPITASYSGDLQDAASVSPVMNQVVKQPAALVLNVAPSSVVVTNSVTLTATATAATGTPTGAVTFYDGAIVIGSVNLNASGVATFTTKSLSAATHSLSTSYAGDGTNGTAQSNVVNEVVNLATTNTTISSSSATVNVGSTITFTAIVVSTNGPLPTGTVQFFDGATSLGPATLDGTGTAALTLSTLTPGTHPIVATYSGDIDNVTSSSTGLVETITQIPTTVALLSNINPANAGATINLTANVAIKSGSTAYGAITGSVTFSDGATILGTAAVNASGQATLGVNSLSAGMHSLSADFTGNTNYAASTSPALSQQILITQTATTLSTSASSSLAGKPVTFTVTVTSSTGIPTGIVTISNGSATLGQATLNTQGTATFTTSTLSLGTLSLSATYAGDTNYVASTSTPLQQIISLATTALTLAGPTAAIDAGTALSVSTTLSSNGVAPTGSLTLRDGNAVIATQSVSATGSFLFSTSGLSIGTHTLTTAYAGDSDNASAVSPAISVIVQQASTTTSLASTANPSIVGQSITLSASVTSDSPSIGGSINFMDGTTTLGTVPLLGVSASITTGSLAFGTNNLTAIYSGDTNHAASTSATIAEQIVQAPTVVLTSSLNPSIVGVGVTFTATFTGVNALVPTGNVIFVDGTTTLGTVALSPSGVATFQTSSLAVGSHPISIIYAGDRNYSAASGSLTQTVLNANTQIALASSANPATYGTALSLIATISCNSGTATGSVNFTDGGVSLGSVALNANGVATLSLSTLAPGTHTIVASYAGDGKASASVSVPYTLVVKQLSSIALTTSANPTLALTPIVLTASVSNSGVGAATGALTFTDGSTLLGTATLDATGKASLTLASLTTGDHSIQASYAGDNNNFSSVSSVVTESVQLRPTTTTLTASAIDPLNPRQATLIAVVHWTGSAPPTGTVLFSIGSTPISSSTVDSTGVATLSIVLQSSPESITASYSGDSSYSSSTSQATAVTASAGEQFTISMNPTSISMQSKQNTVVNLTIASVQSFADTLQFGCIGLPYAATCTFSTPQTTLTANGTASVQLTIDTGNPLGSGAQASLRNLRNSPVALCFLPGAFLAGLFFLRRRRRPLLGLLLLLCAVTATLSVTGCSGLQTSGTPPGTYTFKISASGQNTGITETQVMTMTITQ